MGLLQTKPSWGRKHLRVRQFGQFWDRVGLGGTGPQTEAGQVGSMPGRMEGHGPQEVLGESGAHSQPEWRKRRLTWLMVDQEDSTRLGEVGMNSLCITAAKVRPGPAGQEGWGWGSGRRHPV